MALDYFLKYRRDGEATHGKICCGRLKPLGRADGACVRPHHYCGAAPKKQMPMQMYRGVQIPRNCREGAVLGCCSPGEGERSARATPKGRERCCHPGKVQSYLSVGGAEQVQEIK